MRLTGELAKCSGFDWDEGNILKNWEKHGVSAGECEQVFFNVPFVAAKDDKHSDQEIRLYTLGRTDTGRRLFVVFTLREDRIRVISARDMNKNEREVYKTYEEKNP